MIRRIIFICAFTLILNFMSGSAVAQKGSFQEWWWRDVPTHKLPHPLDSPLQKQRADQRHQERLRAIARQSQRRIATANEESAKQARLANEIKQKEQTEVGKLLERVAELEELIKSLKRQVQPSKTNDSFKRQ